jgi:hypothetical protein
LSVEASKVQRSEALLMMMSFKSELKKNFVDAIYIRVIFFDKLLYDSGVSLH